MGLAISVGDLASAVREDPEDGDWLREQIAQVNAVLKEKGLPEHSEPLDVPEIEYSCVISFPYSFLHYLRRVQVRKALGKPVTPVSGKDLSEEDESDAEQAYASVQTHLLQHSDCEGFYVPIEFDVPLADERLPGGTIGSTQGLFREVLALAQDIDISLEGSEPSAASKVALEAFDETHPFYIERVVWHALHENCVYSLRYKSLISFG